MGERVPVCLQRRFHRSGGPVLQKVKQWFCASWLGEGLNMAERKAISKRKRFEVFKRDAFTCQYCGAHPPSAILHVDHIHPVSKGGGNDIDNLITACQPCNSGKSNVELNDVPQSLQDKAAMVLEREAQIKGYQSVMDAKRLRLEEEAAQICEVYETFNPGFTLTDKSMVTIRMFIDKLGVHCVQSAMELAWAVRKVRTGGEFKYFCGICWNKIRESGA